MIIQQVKFRPIGEEAWQGGIYLNYHLQDSYIICGCCGGLFEMDEIEEYSLYEDWVDISEEIIGDERV